MDAGGVDHPGRLGVGLGRAALWLVERVHQARDIAVSRSDPALRAAHRGLLRLERERDPHVWRVGFADTLRAREVDVPRRAMTYGRTPLAVARGLLSWAGVGAGSFVFDAGAGRGWVLLAARALGARARGAELLADHVEHAGPVLEPVGAELVHADATAADLREVTHVYSTWTLFPEALRGRLVEAWRDLPAGAKILTVGGAITAPGFESRGHRTVLMPWGIEQVYLQERVEPQA